MYQYIVTDFVVVTTSEISYTFHMYIVSSLAPSRKSNDLREAYYKT